MAYIYKQWPDMCVCMHTCVCSRNIPGNVPQLLITQLIVQVHTHVHIPVPVKANGNIPVHTLHPSHMPLFLDFADSNYVPIHFSTAHNYMYLYMYLIPIGDTAGMCVHVRYMFLEKIPGNVPQL